MKLLVLRKRIGWLVNAGIVLLVVVLVSVCLGLILSGAGDVSGAGAVRGLTYVALSMLVIDFLVLVGHLAAAVLLLLDRSDSSGEPNDEVSVSDSKSNS